jgi:CDP-glycerol glycerophosphotransferase (TagB/SpsB family)
MKVYVLKYRGSLRVVTGSYRQVLATVKSDMVFKKMLTNKPPTFIRLDLVSLYREIADIQEMHNFISNRDYKNDKDCEFVKIFSSNNLTLEYKDVDL